MDNMLVSLSYDELINVDGGGWFTQFLAIVAIATSPAIIIADAPAGIALAAAGISTLMNDHP